jgi:beta-glucosidase-like glycosyl hydrolase
MTKLNLNAFCDHRKFDGVLECITLNIKNIPEDLKQKKKDIINDENIKKVNRILSYGKISQFLTDEDYSGEDEDYSGEEESIDEDELSTSDEEDKIVLATNSLSLNSGKEKVLI